MAGKCEHKVTYLDRPFVLPDDGPEVVKVRRKMCKTCGKFLTYVIVSRTPRKGK